MEKPDLTQAFTAASRLEPALDAMHNTPGSTFNYSIQEYAGAVKVFTNIIVDVAPDDDSDAYVPTLSVTIEKDGSMHVSGDTHESFYGNSYTTEKTHIASGEDPAPIAAFIHSTAKKKGMLP